MEKVKIKTNYINLGQFLKWIGLASTGGEAKMMITENMIKVNGQLASQRGLKLKEGDTVEVGDRSFLIEVKDG